MRARVPRLELLSGPTLAGLLGCSHDAFQRRRRHLPLPLRLGGRRFWLRSEVDHLVPGRRYSDDVTAPELAGLVQCSVDAIYQFIRRGVIPQGRRQDRRVVWSRAAVERHLASLPR